VALTQTQLTTAVADRAELSRNDAKRALAALDEIVLDQLGNAQKVRIGGLVQLTVRVKPRPGRADGSLRDEYRPLEVLDDPLSAQ
jgi:nucleoid DNA-binding protein